MKIIKVTKEHIKKGKRESETDCPIGLACKELSPGCAVTVDPDDGIFIKNEARFEARFVQYKSSRILEFIHDFDSGSNVEPFEIHLEDL